MTKKPRIKHEYDAKKDKLEITIHGYALTKKSARNDIMRKVVSEVEKSPARLIAGAKKRGANSKPKKLRGLQKDQKLIEVGD